MTILRRALGAATAGLLLLGAVAPQASAAGAYSVQHIWATNTIPGTPAGAWAGHSAEWVDHNTVESVLGVTDNLCDGRGGKGMAQFLIRKNWWSQAQWVDGWTLSTIGCKKTNSTRFTYGRWNNLYRIYRIRVRVCYDDSGCISGPSYVNPYA